MEEIPHVPYEDVFLFSHRLSQGVPQGHLCEVLQRRVDGVPNGLVENTLHPPHQDLEPLYHGNHLDTTHTGKGVLWLLF